MAILQLYGDVVAVNGTLFIHSNFGEYNDFLILISGKGPYSAAIKFVYEDMGDKETKSKLCLFLNLAKLPSESPTCSTPCETG